MSVLGKEAISGLLGVIIDGLRWSVQQHRDIPFRLSSIPTTTME